MVKDHGPNRGAATAGRTLAVGSVLSAITTAIVGIRREHYGRGAMHAKAYVNDDLIVVVMRANGLTPFERTLVEGGEPERVIALRTQFLDLMAGLHTRTVEQLTHRRVLAFLHHVTIEPDITLESFLLDEPLDAGEQLELTSARQQRQQRAELDLALGELARGVRVADDPAPGIQPCETAAQQRAPQRDAELPVA